MECWSNGVLECWSNGVLECWRGGVRVIDIASDYKQELDCLGQSNTPLLRRSATLPPDCSRLSLGRVAYKNHTAPGLFAHNER